MHTEHFVQDPKAGDNEPFWPAVEWGAAAIVVVGALLLLPAGAYFLTLLTA